MLIYESETRWKQMSRLITIIVIFFSKHFCRLTVTAYALPIYAASWIENSQQNKFLPKSINHRRSYNTGFRNYFMLKWTQRELTCPTSSRLLFLNYICTAKKNTQFNRRQNMCLCTLDLWLIKSREGPVIRLSWIFFRSNANRSVHIAGVRC